jgi:uncharacterized protein
MITIKELFQDTSLPGNYFAPDTYVKGDFESGLIENRQGGRLLAISETLMHSIHTALESEVGSSVGIVLFKCGLWWGKNFYQRFTKEVSAYYQKSVSEMKMIELLQCLKECWKTHGWGIISLDFDYYQQGFLVVKIEQSAFAKVIESATQPSCFLEAGMLSAFFSQLSGTKLHCVQTACESLGVECNLFILGLAKRLEPVTEWIDKGEHHNHIMERLCSNQD